MQTVPPHRRRFPSAFTLVELLVVIGIIAVLVGMLMPAMGAARSQSRSVACLSNLRQIAAAAMMYAQENKVYVSYVKAIDTRPPIDRKELLYPYLQQGKNNSDLNERDVWSCPANSRPDVETSYGFNTKFGGVLDRGVKLSGIRRWSETVAIVDAGLKDQPVGDPSTSTHCWTPGQLANANSCRPNHLRHPRRRVNVGFVDGHAENLVMEQPFYPGPVGTYTPLNLTDPSDPNYQDKLWDLE